MVETVEGRRVDIVARHKIRYKNEGTRFLREDD